jgi:hypothetical protein
MSIVMAIGLMLSSVCGVAVAQAQSDTTTSHGPFYFVAQNPCNGEYVGINGQLTLVGHTTVNGNGGAQDTGRFALTGTGVGQSGKYELLDTFGGAQTYNGATEQTNTFNFRLITDNRTSNFLVNATFHITVNNDGTLTVEVTHFDTKCTGGG